VIELERSCAFGAPTRGAHVVIQVKAPFAPHTIVLPQATVVGVLDAEQRPLAFERATLGSAWAVPETARTIVVQPELGVTVLIGALFGPA
jgi:hypothetical protein